MPQPGAIEKALKDLIGKSVTITYIGRDTEQHQVEGKLKNVTEELLEFACTMGDSTILRENIKVMEVRSLPASVDSNTVKLFIRKQPDLKITGTLLRKIGLLIQQGKTCGKDNPKGVEWELANWDIVPPEPETPG